MKNTQETAPPTPDSKPSDEAFTYELLKGHGRTDGTYKTSQQLRMEYITLTDQLIDKIQGGAYRTNPETGQVEKQPFDHVVFLDKSARPVAWLMQELWPKLAFDEDEKPTPMPTIDFLNIDRHQWIDLMDVNGSGMLEVDHLPKHITRGLRSVFASPVVKHGIEKEIEAAAEEGVTLHPDSFLERFDTTPTLLDGKNVLIVDEVRSTGRTKDIAVKLLSAAFPTAHIEGTFWMSSQTARLTPKAGGIAFGNADLPVWYREDTVLGRGIGDRQLESGVEPKSLTQKLGRYFLSSRLPEVDPLSLKLRRELHELATNPDVPVRPSHYRDDYDERMARLNPGKSPDEVEATIRAIHDQKERL